MIEFLSSKEILSITGISRSTLNNYIRMGILPKPIVRRPDNEKSTIKKIGYFPKDAVLIIHHVNDLKRQGRSMNAISGVLSAAIDQKPPSLAPKTSEKKDSDPKELPLFPGEFKREKHLGKPQEMRAAESPALSPVAVLSVFIQEFDVFRHEIPPDEVSWLIEQIGRHCIETSRRNGGITHFSDGFHLYFRIGTDAACGMAALDSARAIQFHVPTITQKWTSRWSRSFAFRFNMGISLGNEFLHRVHGCSGSVLMIPGIVYKEARALSLLAEEGSLWATRTFILMMESIGGVNFRYGIHRDGRFVDRIFRRIGNFPPENKFFEPIATGPSPGWYAAEVLL